MQHHVLRVTAVAVVAVATVFGFAFMCSHCAKVGVRQC